MLYKSNFTKALDIFRNLLILAVTVYLVYLLWGWHWLAAIIGAIPIYVIVMNIIGFITLPLYFFTPESRQVKKEQDELFKDLY